MNVQRSPSRAVAWMVAAVACFSLMDAGMKQLSASYPTLEVTFLRGAASLPFVLVWVLVSAGPLAGAASLGPAPAAWRAGHGDDRLLRVRPARPAAVHRLHHLLRRPAADRRLSVPLLGERVGPRRWVAIGIGLVGVLVVLRPGVDGFISVPGLMVLAAATPMPWRRSRSAC
jgi:drug/metabolite transporter (DMT)-like permease